MDKAPRDFPNDLLHEFDALEFEVADWLDARGRPHRISARGGPDDGFRLIVLTSNGERQLPGAFLRRCVHHHLRFDAAALARVVHHRVAEGDLRLDSGLVDLAVERFVVLRGLPGLRHRPGLAELLVWLRATLESLLASGTEGTLFRVFFDDFFPEEEVPEWLARRLDGAQGAEPAWEPRRALDEVVAAAAVADPPGPLPSPVPPKPPTGDDEAEGDPPARPRRRLRAAAWGAALAAAAAVGLGLWWSTRPPPAEDPEEVAVRVGSDLDGDADDDDAVEEVSSHSIEEIRAVDLPASPFPWGRVLPRAGAAGAALALALALAARIRRRLACPLPPPPEYDLREVEPDVRSPEPPRPWTEKELDALAYLTGVVADPDQRHLDVPATVREAAREAGWVRPIYRPGRAVRGLAVARLAPLDGVASTVLDAFVAGLRARGVPVREVAGPRDAAGADLALVVVDAREEAGADLGPWAALAHVALVEARDEALWGPEVGDLPRAPFPLTAPGLVQALGAAGAGRRPPPSPRPAPGDGIAALGDALPWGAAAALAAASAPVDLGTLDALRREFAPHLPWIALQRLAAPRGVAADPSGWTFAPAIASPAP